MQVNNITPLNKRYIYNAQTRTNIVPSAAIPSIPSNSKVAKAPLTQDYLTFTGGYSLKLDETIRHLDKLAETTPNVYPKNIREWASLILDAGNKANETLINIHKKYYENLKKCSSLAEAKDKFKEFSEVLSDKGVSFSKDSFGQQ